nr:hypothetical protein [Tanacetum cinerariifolium]
MLVHEFILEFFSTFRFGEAVLDLDTAGALQFQFGKVKRRMSWREFIMALGLHSAEEIITRRIQAPKKVTVTDLFYPRGMVVGSVNKGDAGGVVEEALVAPEEEEVHGMREALQGQREVLDIMDCDFSMFTTWTINSLARLMNKAGLRKKYRLNHKNDMPPRDKMDDPNITMEEYIRLEEEKARKLGKCLTGKLLSMVRSVFDKNWFSYKIIYVDDLKTDSKNDNEKVNMPSFPSLETKVSCIDDLDFFKDFENEFLAIIYKDALTYKSYLLTEPTLCPQHIDKFDFKVETSLPEYDEEEQNVLYFNDLFLFNIIYNDLKLDKGNDDNEIDMIQYSRGNENTQGSNEPLEGSHDKINKVFIMKSFVMELNVNIMAWNYFVNGVLFNLIKNLYVSFGIPFDPKRYYKDGDCTRMMQRPRMRMEHRDADRVVVFTSQVWSRVLETRGPVVKELILEFLSTLRFREVLLDLDALGTILFQLRGARRHISWMEFILALGLHTREEMEYWSENERMVLGKGDLRDYWRDISTDGDFLGPSPSYTLIRDLVLRLFHKMMAHSIAGGDAGRVVEKALMALGGGDEDEEMPQALPSPPRSQGERIDRLEEEVHGIRKEPYKNHRIQLLPIEHSAQVGDIVEFETAIAQTFLYLRQFLHHSSANSWQWDLHSSGSGNLYCQWELSPGSRNALCILFPTILVCTAALATYFFFRRCLKPDMCEGSSTLEDCVLVRFID